MAEVEQRSLGYWRTFKRTTDYRSKTVKELTSITAREPQKWWFPASGRNVIETLYNGDVHVFFSTSDIPVVCITMLRHELHEIMGNGYDRTVEPLYKKEVDEFIRKNTKLAIMVEALQNEARQKGWDKLTEEEKTVVSTGGLVKTFKTKDPKNVASGGRIYFAPGTFSNVVQSAVTAAQTGTKSLSQIRSEMEAKIKQLRNKAEQARQTREMAAKSQKVVQLITAFGGQMTFDQLNQTLEFLYDTVTNGMIAKHMMHDTVKQLDSYIKSSAAQALIKAEPIFKELVQNYINLRTGILVEINKRTQTSSTQQAGQKPQQPKPAPFPSAPPQNPPAPPRPSAPPKPSVPPSVSPPPPPVQKPKANAVSSQKFIQGLEDEIEAGLTEPKNKQINQGKPKSKSQVKPNSNAVKQRGKVK